ncbi:Proclotting enzyme [Araneus ventricosus]|uniref:Proclotting enzyme n=1 Tax=Araneus ventricosus TaxID=182803 RepID=A0A4Y2EUQ1_ARAVE|nr:Proclotting enzyme [Araneus ventricosus]
MKYRSCIGKILLLLYFFLLDETCAQRQNRHARHNLHPQDCPRGTRCMERRRCRPSVLKGMAEPPGACGLTYNGKERICCPEKKPLSAPFAPPRPTTPELPVVTRVGPKRPEGEKKCGAVFRGASMRAFVMGGKQAKQGAWPWMVAISMRDRRGIFHHVCTGAMITSRHVLSAAHCFDRRQPSLYVARIGHVNRHRAYEYGISRIEVPRTFERGRYYDDIAVLTLSTEVSSDIASPVCLPESSEYTDLVGKGTTAAGWGATQPDTPSSDILMELPAIPVISNRECSTILFNKNPAIRQKFPRGITDGFMCAGFMDAKKDTCGVSIEISF